MWYNDAQLFHCHNTATCISVQDEVLLFFCNGLKWYVCNKEKISKSKYLTLLLSLHTVDMGSVTNIS
jgi:predicted ribosome-associated RNA-binding protein Tma20